jgi:hypothetical protein
MSIEAMKQALEALENNKRKHYYCEDTWYSCPQEEGGCANDYAGDECNCGADEANREIDAAITALRQALEQPADEPVAWGMENDSGQVYDCITPEEHARVEGEYTVPLYRGPQPAAPEQQLNALKNEAWNSGVCPVCNSKDEPKREPLTREQALKLWGPRSDGPENHEIISFTRAIEAAHGITGKKK